MVLMSEATKQVLELTAPGEDRMEEAQERPWVKYVSVVAECSRQWRKACCEPVEVGCRGFRRAISALGPENLRVLQRQRAIAKILEVAGKTSSWLWIKRGDELRHTLGPDHPWLGCTGEGKNPEHTMTPGPSLTMCPGYMTRCSIWLLAACPDEEALKCPLFTLLLLQLMYMMMSSPSYLLSYPKTVEMHLTWLMTAKDSFSTGL